MEQQHRKPPVPPEVHALKSRVAQLEGRNRQYRSSFLLEAEISSLRSANRTLRKRLDSIAGGDEQEMLRLYKAQDQLALENEYLRTLVRTLRVDNETLRAQRDVLQAPEHQQQAREEVGVRMPRDQTTVQVEFKAGCGQHATFQPEEASELIHTAEEDAHSFAQLRHGPALTELH